MPRGIEEEVHPIDRHVGRRVQERRLTLGMSQTALASAIGVSFQQVQKYEKGSNRISASKLFEIAGFMKTGIPFFFEGYSGTPGMAEGTAAHFDHEQPVTRHAMEIARLAQRLPAAKQKLISQTIRAMLGEEETEDA